MKRVGLLLVGLLCLSVVAYAGSMITNDTSEDATGLRVVFSSSVLLTGFGDAAISSDASLHGILWSRIEIEQATKWFCEGNGSTVADPKGKELFGLRTEY